MPTAQHKKRYRVKYMFRKPPVKKPEPKIEAAVVSYPKVNMEEFPPGLTFEQMDKIVRSRAHTATPPCTTLVLKPRKLSK